MRKLLAVLFIFLFLIFGIISLFNVFSLPAKQLKVKEVELLPVDEEKVVAQLSELIKIKSTPFELDSLQELTIKDFQLYLKKTFPKIHTSENVKLEKLDNFIIFKWQGLNQRLKPILFVGDLCTQEPDIKTITRWKYSPFMGKVSNGSIWGAGSMDKKSTTTALLQAWEQLISDQQIPDRSLFIAIRLTKGSEDDQISWEKVVSSFHNSNIQPEAVYGIANYIDQSPCLTVNAPIAWVGVAEQKVLQLQLNAKDKEALAKRIDQLDKKPDWAIDKKQPIYQSFSKGLLPELSFKEKWLLSNQYYFGNWMKKDIQNHKQLCNLLYSKVEAQEISKKDSSSTYSMLLKFHLQANVELEAFKEQVQSMFNQFELNWQEKDKLGSLSCSPTSGYAFEVLKTSIKQSLGNPLLMPAIESENGFYEEFHQLSPNCYSFNPYLFEETDIICLTSRVNHHLSIENYIQAIGFYHQFLRNILI